MGSFLGTILRGDPRPTVPKFKPIDIEAEQKKAIAANAGAFPEASKLVSDTNLFNAEQLNKMLELAIPGYSKLRDKGTSAIQGLLSGDIPEDVSDAVKRRAATGSYYRGFGGTGAADALTARDLGVTSLDIIGKGLDAATRWIASAKVAPMLDLTSMFITPLQRIAHATSERDKAWNVNWLRKQVHASFPGVLEEATAVAADTIAETAFSYLGSLGGGGIGGMGGSSTAPSANTTGAGIGRGSGQVVMQGYPWGG